MTLTATPAASGTFLGWDGACSGERTICTVTMDAAKSVSAAFKGTSRTPSGQAGALRITGHAVVRRTSAGFRVTLRFVAPRRGIAHVRALLAGRLQTALSFTVAPGRATVGPFPVAKPGFYVFEVALGLQELRWTACLGRCGAAAHAAPFVLARGPAKAVDAGALWSLTAQLPLLAGRRSADPRPPLGQARQGVALPGRSGRRHRRAVPALARQLSASTDRDGHLGPRAEAHLVCVSSLEAVATMGFSE